MRIRIAVILLISLLSIDGTKAQISHGGTPLFLEKTRLRSAGSAEVFEMPAFNVDSVKQSDALSENQLRGGFHFAYKFQTHIEKGKDGKLTVLSDGTKVWQVEIRSAGAYSLNLLFTKYRIPEGGQLFIYNTDRSHIIGSFDHRNNADSQIFPTRPVGGDAIIVEYSEPANVAFEGELVIGEVNHDYRGALRAEPGTDPTGDSSVPESGSLCMPDVLCADADDAEVRATVLLMVNGTTGCTATLVNNTSGDGTPYMLTASHCFIGNPLVNVNPQDYVTKAKTAIAFFNYNRPVCGTKMKATEEMSIARAIPRVIIGKKDITLLEFQETPPLYYNAYYAGWNVNSNPGTDAYTNIHHPAFTVKKYGSYTGAISLVSVNDRYAAIGADANSHWEIPRWDIGSTYPGSSGSALFNSNHQVIGGLTTGNSFCSETNPNGESDWFYALYKGWTNATEANNQLKDYLDPGNTGVSQCDGFDPNTDYQLSRIGNANYNAGDTLTKTAYSAPDSGLLFGKNSLAATEFAEEFQNDSIGTLEGVFVYLPKMAYATGVEINIYSGENAPETLLDSKTFHPQYVNYSEGNFGNANQSTNVADGTENFVRFDALPVGKKFYVAYSVAGTSSSEFAVYNSRFASPTATNSAWIKNAEDVWTKADEYTPNPLITALAIQPLLHFTTISTIFEENNVKNTQFVYLRDENILILPTISAEAGIVSIYNTQGQLLQQTQIAQKQESVILNRQLKNSMGIVRLTRGNHICTGKFIY